jgi:ATP-binding cassette subfamily B protein
MIRPYRRLGAVAALGTASIALNVTGPLLLGRATDLIFAGMIGRQFPPGMTKAEVADQLREQGDGALVSLINTVDFVPGQGVDFAALSVVLLAAAAVYAASGAFWMAQGRYTTQLVQRTVFQLRQQVEEKLYRLPLSYFDVRPRGEVLSRATNDIDNVASSLQQTVSQITNSSLLLIGVVAMMFWISPLLSVVALVAVPLSMVMTKWIGKRAQANFSRQWKVTGQLSSHVDETYTGHAVVKAFGQEQASVEAFREQNQQLFEASARAQFISGVIGPTTTLIGNVSYVLVAVLGGLMIAAGNLSIGAVQAFVQYSRQFTQPLMALANLSNHVQSGVASAERVWEFLDEEEETAGPVTVAPPGRPGRVRGEVRFESISFRYHSDRPLIEDLSLTVVPGGLVAIVGPTGAGKTTLVNLLMRFYDVTGGRITIDGVDSREMHRDYLRSQIGMVPQDAWLFRGTIRDNIAYGRADATDDDVVAAADAVKLDHVIRTLPHGYDSVVDGEGGSLSAGEQQLVTIARAIVAKPAILVLDEATSSVDTRTEFLIQQAMARLSEGRTSFVIAHRLSTIRDADLILMMSDGAIVERGTHAELVAADGAYARMYEAQFAQPVEVMD